MTTTHLRRTGTSDRQALRSRRERNRLIEQEMGLAERIAADYRQRGIDRDDLRQVALLGLVKAAERFDDSRGTRFTVFASLTINGEIKRHFRDQGWSVRPPRSVQEAYLNVRRAQDALSQELGRSPDVSELADRTGLDTDDVLVAIAAQGSYRARPLDPPSADDAPVRSNEPATPEVGFERVNDEIEVDRLTEDLSERDRQILHLRFWEGLTQSDIADQVGVSQVQVSRLLRSIKQRVREQAHEHAQMVGGYAVSSGDRT